MRSRENGEGVDILGGERWLFLTLGPPGSGKSEFVNQLAREMKAVIINGDSMRAAIFQNNPQRIKASYNRRGGPMVYGAVDEAVERILPVISVILDANNSRYSLRRERADWAQTIGARAAVIHMDTPLEESIRRAGARDRSGHQVPVEEAIVRRMAGNIEPPREDEMAIRIDGTVPFEEQYNQFREQFRQ